VRGIGWGWETKWWGRGKDRDGACGDGSGRGQDLRGGVGMGMISIPVQVSSFCIADRYAEHYDIAVHRQTDTQAAHERATCVATGGICATYATKGMPTPRGV